MTIRNYRCFNSRTPRGVRHRLSARRTLPKRFNSRTPRGVRLTTYFESHWDRVVSIHAPRVGCDGELPRRASNINRFNSRTPRGVRPRRCPLSARGCRRFNSRTPRGVRLVLAPLNLIGYDVSIHAPRVGCDCVQIYLTRPGEYVSIHAPRVGCDLNLGTRGELLVAVVSIHAPRVGCDSCKPKTGSSTLSFNSRTPRGVRHRLSYCMHRRCCTFQFTHPAWGATKSINAAAAAARVSIHAPRVGCDVDQLPAYRSGREVSIHAPRVGCDLQSHLERVLP